MNFGDSSVYTVGDHPYMYKYRKTFHRWQEIQKDTRNHPQFSPESNMIVNGEGKINGNAIYTLVSEEECREMSADLEHSYCPKQKIGYNAFETTLRY